MDGEDKKQAPMAGLFQIFEAHKADLETIYDKFKPYPSFEKIISLEYKRWKFTDTEAKSKLEKHLKKSGGKLSLDDWILFIQSHGMPVDTISSISKQEVPGKLFLTLAERAET